MPTVMYAAITDPYCYSGTTVLKNRLGLRKQAKLAAFENEVTSARADQDVPAGRLSYRHYRAIHRHLFQDVYSWAGKVRTVRISKGGNPFCYPEHIDREMKRLFADLRRRKFLRDVNVAEFAAGAAHFLAEVNAIHPFREGNGRTQLSFLKVMAERAGYPMAWSVAAHAAILRATVRSFGGDEQPLAKIILQSVRHRRR
jgi:cell filamentation protein, protein adenylyltransferase